MLGYFLMREATRAGRREVCTKHTCRGACVYVFGPGLSLVLVGEESRG